MSFGTMLLRSILFVIGSLLGLIGIGMLLSLPGTRDKDILRREDLHTAWRMVEKQRAQQGTLPSSVSVETTAGNGRFESDISVVGWKHLDWMPPRDFSQGGASHSPERDYLLSYSNSSCDWCDFLDSRTGQTTLDHTGLHYYLLPPIALLLIAGFLFRQARRLLRQNQLGW